MKQSIKKYEIDIFDEKQLKELQKVFGNVANALESEEFMDFIALKCMKELNSIIDANLRTEGYETEYRDNNHYETNKDQIHIYNDSMVDLSNLESETAANYPEGLSLAKIIEFGTGIEGSDSADYDWKTEFNPERDYSKGWVYEKNGQLHWTKGQQGHFIYQKLLTATQQNMESWVMEYLTNKLN